VADPSSGGTEAIGDLGREAIAGYSPEEADRRSETPVDDNNHALPALRYLIRRHDARHMTRLRRRSR